MTRTSRLKVMTAVTGAIFAPVTFAAQWQFATGAEYSRGTYGELTSTEALIVPLSLKMTVGNFSLRASVPYLGVRGPADIAPVIDDSGDSGSDSGSSGSSGSGSSGGSDDSDGSDDEDFPVTRDVHGLGDTTLSATWAFVDLWDTRLYVDVTGRVRLPTGDETQGLGTGTTDYAALAELGWGGRTGGVFVSGGRRLLESTPTVQRQDGWQASAGYWRNIGKSSVFGMQANWRTATLATGVDPRSVDAFLTRRLSTGWKMEVSGSAGLSQSSPDYVAGLRFIWRSQRR